LQLYWTIPHMHLWFIMFPQMRMVPPVQSLMMQLERRVWNERDVDAVLEIVRRFEVVNPHLLQLLQPCDSTTSGVEIRRCGTCNMGARFAVVAEGTI
jgi:hypothetical protein